MPEPYNKKLETCPMKLFRVSHLYRGTGSTFPLRQTTKVKVAAVLIAARGGSSENADQAIVKLQYLAILGLPSRYIAQLAG